MFYAVGIITSGVTMLLDDPAVMFTYLLAMVNGFKDLFFDSYISIFSALSESYNSLVN